MENLINGHEFVDLGLSVKWARCNVGAQIPEEYGEYFAWGEIEPKRLFNEETSETYKKIIEDISGTSRDVARVKWGAPWRMPTKEEFSSLIFDCKWEEIKGDVRGIRVTGRTGYSIFLPAAGYRDRGLLKEIGDGYYWCSTPNDKEDDTAQAYRCILNLNTIYTKGGVGIDPRYSGFQVRPVLDLP